MSTRRRRSFSLHAACISAGLALTVQATEAFADPDFITADGHAITKLGLTGERRCGDPPASIFNGMLSDEFVVGKYGDHEVRVVTGPGSAFGLLAIRMNVIGQQTVPDGLTLKLFEGPSCTAGGEDAEGVRTTFAVPPALVGSPGEWMISQTIPRTADGVVYVATHKYLLAVDPSKNTVNKVIDWSDVLVMLGDDTLPEQPGAYLGFAGAIATPAGEIRIWLKGPRFNGFIAYDPKSASTQVLFGQDPWTATYDMLGGASVLTWDSTYDAIVLGGTYANPSARITFIPADPAIPTQYASRPSPFFPGILQNFNQSAWVLPVEAGHPIFGESAISDLSEVDMDGDGLLDMGEAALGTSPVATDTDGDGLFDKAEASIFTTDPLSSASAPPRAVPVVTYAPSTLISDWQFLELKNPSDEDGPFLMFTRASIFENTRGFPTPALCVDLECRGPDGSLLGTLEKEPDKSFSIAISGEGYATRSSSGAVSFTTFPSSKVTVLDASAAAEIPMDAQMIAVRGGPSTHEIYFRLPGVGVQIWRVLDGEVLLIVDTAREGCPIVASQDELARCGDPDLASPSTFVDWAGYDTAHGALLVSTTKSLTGTPDPTSIVAVAAQSQAPVLRPEDFVWNRHVDFGLYRDPSGAFVMPSRRYTPDEQLTVPTVHRLDAAMRPIDVRFPLARDFVGGAFYGDGFFSPLQFDLYLTPGPSSGIAGPCCFDNICVEEWASSTKTIKTPFFAKLAALWIPVPDVPAAGEAIVAALWTTEKGETSPALWRLGARGELAPWLSATDLINLVADPAEKPTLETFHDPTSLGTSPSAKEICFVEGDSKRVWRLSLDADGPKVLERVAKDIASPIACAYTDANELAVLAAEPSRIVIGNKTLPLDGLEVPRQLHMLDGRWLVTAARDTALCVDPQTGATTDSGVRVGTFARGPGGSLGYVDIHGYGFLGTTDDFCAGRPPIERFDTGSMNLWTRSSETLSHRWSEASAGSLLVMQESGLAYVAPLAQWALSPFWYPDRGFLDTVGNEVDRPDVDPTDGPTGEGPPSSPRGGISRLRPAYMPVDCDIKLPGLDGARRLAAKMRPAAWTVSATAMAVLGGGTLAESEDWEWRGMTKPVPPTCAEQGGMGGGSGGGGGSPTGTGGNGVGGSAPDGGCGCRVGPSEGGDVDAGALSGCALSALAFGLLRRRRARARRRAGAWI